MLYLFVIVAFVTNCSSDKQLIDVLPCIDVRKVYPVKKIILTDIADVTYIHLNTENADYLYRGGIKYITDSTIVVVDDASGSILFFSIDGKPKSRFNRYGNGPEEYSNKFFSIVFDEAADDVFVNIPSFFLISGNSILVFSSTGEYKRKLPLSWSALSLIDFDRQSLFLYSLQNQYRKLMREKTDVSSQSVDSSYFRISKTDGKVLTYVNFPDNVIDLTDRGGGIRRVDGYMRITNSAAGLFFCNPETDTVFLYNKDNTLTPIICKTPLVSDQNPKVILNDFVDVGKYQFIRVYTIINADHEFKIPQDERYDYLNKHYIHDKKTGEIFRQKISLPDYEGKDFFITAQKTHFNGKKTLAHFELDLIELKQANRENKLNGKLKKLVDTLNEKEDNNVLILLNFK